VDRVFALTGLHVGGCQGQYCLYVVCFRYLHLSLFIRQLCRGKSRADSANELAYCKVVLPRVVKHQKYVHEVPTEIDNPMCPYASLSFHLLCH